MGMPDQATRNPAYFQALNLEQIIAQAKNRQIIVRIKKLAGNEEPLFPFSLSPGSLMRDS